MDIKDVVAADETKVAEVVKLLLDLSVRDYIEVRHRIDQAIDWYDDDTD